jgi:hypothetical protein
VAPRATAEGTAIVNSRPDGALVIIDGEPRGVTPLKVALKTGDHALEILKADLKLLATGFRELAVAQLAAPSNSTGPAGRPDRIASTANVVAGAPVAGGSPAAIFTAADAGITAPVELTRVMPPWRPAGELTRRSFFGVLEIVVNEQGAVETAVIRERVTPAYDAALLKAAKGWSFRSRNQGWRAGEVPHVCPNSPQVDSRLT